MSVSVQQTTEERPKTRSLNDRSLCYTISLVMDRRDTRARQGGMDGE